MCCGHTQTVNKFLVKSLALLLMFELKCKDVVAIEKFSGCPHPGLNAEIHPLPIHVLEAPWFGKGVVSKWRSVSHMCSHGTSLTAVM